MSPKVTSDTSIYIYIYWYTLESVTGVNEQPTESQKHIGPTKYTEAAVTSDIKIGKSLS